MAKRNQGFGKKHPTKEEKIKIVNLYMKGRSSSDLCKTFGYHQTSISRWIREAKNGSSFDRKHSPRSGRFCKIDHQKAKQLIKIIKQPATKFGFETSLWNPKRIQIICKKELKIKVSRMLMWRFLKDIGYSSKKVQKVYRKANQKKRDEWTKKTVPSIKRIVKKCKAILYFEDESNISLSPITVSTSRSPKKERIAVKVTGKTGKTGSVAAIISAISNDGRLIFSLHNSGKRFKAKDITKFLGQMLSYHSRRHLVVVMDQAPCHTEKCVKDYIASQRRLHVFYLPSYSPD